MTEKGRFAFSIGVAFVAHGIFLAGLELVSETPEEVTRTPISVVFTEVVVEVSSGRPETGPVDSASDEPMPVETEPDETEPDEAEPDETEPVGARASSSEVEPTEPEPDRLDGPTPDRASTLERDIAGISRGEEISRRRPQISSERPETVPPTIEPVRFISPEYPEYARSRGIEGTVVVEILIDRRGRADEIRIVTPSGSEVLDREVLRAIGQWRFSRDEAGNITRHRFVFRLE